MRIKDIFKEKTVFSFEVFPPKKTSSIDVIYKTLDEMKGLDPDFISVTFSAGGSGNGGFACDIASKIKEMGITPVIHLPCINNTKEEIFVIRPSKKIKMKRIEKDESKLQEMYELGKFDANRVLEKLINWMAK